MQIFDHRSDPPPLRDFIASKIKKTYRTKLRTTDNCGRWLEIFNHAKDKVARVEANKITVWNDDAFELLKSLVHQFENEYQCVDYLGYGIKIFRS